MADLEPGPERLLNAQQEGEVNHALRYRRRYNIYGGTDSPLTALCLDASVAEKYIGAATALWSRKRGKDVFALQMRNNARRFRV